MAELRLSGLATGIDTGKMVEQLMEVNRRRLYMMNRDVEKHQEKRSAISEFQSKLSSLKSASDTLSDSSQLKSFNAKTSDEDFITANASSDAIEGNHSVQVKQLATSDRWIHDGFKYSTSMVGAGTLILSYDFQEFSVTAAANTSLEGLVGLINNDSENPGINASILKYDDGNDGIYHLVLSGKESGSDYQIQVNASTTEVLTMDEPAFLDANNENATGTTKITDLTAFSGTLVDPDEAVLDQIHILGNQHYNGMAVDYYFDVTEYTTLADVVNEINNAFEGTAKATLENGKIILTDGTCGASDMSISMSFSAGSGGSASLTLPTITQTTAGGTAATITGFEESTFNQVQFAQDSKIRVDDYPKDDMQIQEVQQLTSSADATSGTYKLKFRGEERTLNFGDDITTIQTALNSMASIQAVGNVTVGGSPPNDSGTPLTITFAATAGNVEQITIDSSLTGGNHTMSTQTVGNDGWISRSTNTVDDAISGITMNLHDTTEDGAGGYNNIEVNLTRDTSALKEKVNALIEAYNATVMFIQENTGYDAEEKKSGILANEYFVSTVWSEMKDPLRGIVTGFDSDDTFTMPSDIGLTFDSDGLLELDASVFDEAIVDDYLGVLALIGDMKSGKSDRTDIKFYDAGSSTTAGEFEVRVYGDGSSITSAQIKLVGDTTWRDATIIENNIVLGDSSTNENNGKPTYPEYNLQITVDLSQTVPGGETAIISVKQGFAGAVEDVLKDILNSRYGSVPISLKSVDTKIENVDKRIEQEEARLINVEKRLIQKFARLEKTLTLMQQQMGALNMI